MTAGGHAVGTPLAAIEMNPDSTVYVAGHRGMVGSALVRRLRAAGYKNLVLPRRDSLDLRDPAAVNAFFEHERPDHVFLAAARVGGIAANNAAPVEFLADNLAIELSVITSAYAAGVRKLLFLGSSCVYPKHAPQPLREEYLLTGPLESTNEWYAVAKISGIKLCQAYRRQYGADFISVMPTNLYGPNDNFDLASSHVLPALIRKFHEAHLSSLPSVAVWGSGQPRREFLHVDDLADACVFIMEADYGLDIVNVGVGRDISIAELAELVREIVGYEGQIVYDVSKPDGTPRKLLDVSVLESLGWTATTGLRQGVTDTYGWYTTNVGRASPK